MFTGKTRVFTIILFIVCSFSNVSGQSQSNENKEAIENGLNLVHKYFFKDKNWNVSSATLEQDVSGLVNFIEDEPIDTILNSLDNSLVRIKNYVFRLPENVEDSLTVDGFLSHVQVQGSLEKIRRQTQYKYANTEIEVPVSLVSDLDQKVNSIEPGKGMQLFTDSVFVMPDSLQIPDVIPDSLLNNPNEFKLLLKKDSIRNSFVEAKRIEYNEILEKNYRDSVVNNYRQFKFEEELSLKTRRFNDSVKVNNYQVLSAYNEEVMRKVNDSLQFVLLTMSAYADYIDSTQISIANLNEEYSDILLQRGNGQFARVWLKNEQNDSVSVLVKSVDKRSVQILLDDGITISRFKETETKDFDFGELRKRKTGINKVGNLYQRHTPWLLGGDGTLGFTQTYLENWKKGGQSAISLLMVLKASANYSSEDNKIKWGNSGEIRNGWIRPGGDDAELQKNNDKFEITSRIGVSAFKRWYYSAELNYNTQFFKGYKYPTSKYPEAISAFMAPASTFFKIGLDYKPNKNFSLFISPITLKNVYVRDTVLVDQTKFGVDATKKAFWEPGLNTDLKFKKVFTPDITYETKYKMFMNYQKPFQKFDISWENLIVLQLTDYINMRMMVQLIYDDNVLFPVYDDNDVKIGEKAKLQIKELITVGFSYKINRKIVTSRRIR